MTHAGGRPTDYTPELAERICALVAAEPHGLKKICAKYDWMPDHQTVKNWRKKYPQFLAQYLEAKELQALEIVDNLWDELEMGCDTTEQIAMLNLKFRFHQWHLSKLAPKQFGDKKEVKQEMNINVHEQDLAHLK